MIYQGQSLQCVKLDGNIAELKLDLQGEAINKFNQATLNELKEVVKLLGSDTSLKGLLITSAKDCFVVGADVTEFTQLFKLGEKEIADWLMGINKIFCDFEDLNMPTVTAINGVALGGGLEFALSTSYRIMSTETKIGLPETKLGIFPGWGGTVRLSRVSGADNAIEWIATGNQWDATAALKNGVVDGIVEPKNVRTSAMKVLNDAIAGKLDWKARRDEKVSPLRLNKVEAMMVFETAKGFVGGAAGPNYPAPMAAIIAMQKGATLKRDEALRIEADGFAKVAKSMAARSLVGLFLGDQMVKKIAKKASKASRPIEMAAVIGAGIMGGGVAYQSASKKIPIIMKDITAKALELGMNEAGGLFEKQVSRSKMTAAEMAKSLSRIHSTLSFGDFSGVDIVVEAVVENEGVKKKVLAELEEKVKPGTILTSNTSTISITRLAEGLKHPENFCGMHFFNPVPKMPLVEVIRGKKSSEAAIATTVAYALALGKTPIVVNDCAGFLVNRVLFPYFSGFTKMVSEGVDYQRIDKVMEKFGWPMGPAYLLDVVGIDTGHHANSVMAAEFPDRMKSESKTVIEAMYEAKRFGQKNGVGFYKYEKDKKGRPKKIVDPETNTLIAGLNGSKKNDSITDDEIVDRMMLPLLFECSRCLEENIVSSPVEVDIALIYGLGFPPFRGGAMMYADTVGIKNLLAKAERYQHLGKLYHPTAQLMKMNDKTFYQI